MQGYFRADDGVSRHTAESKYSFFFLIIPNIAHRVVLQV